MKINLLHSVFNYDKKLNSSQMLTGSIKTSCEHRALQFHEVLQ